MALHSFTIFTKKNMIKNVLPFFLDGGIQEINQGDAWNGTSSFVKVDASSDLVSVIFGERDSNNNRVKHGTMVVVTATNATNTITIAPNSDFNAAQDTILLTANGDSVLLMFKGPSGSNVYGEWVVLSRFQADTDTDTVFTGGTVSDDTTFQGSVTLEGNVTLQSGVTLGDSNSNKVEVNGKLIKGNITVTDVDAQDHTLTAAEFLTGIVLHTSVAGPGSITFDTAENLISTLELEADNEVATCLYINDGNQDVTLNGGGPGGSPTGVTYVNNPTIPAEGSATLVVRRTSASTVQVIIA